MYHKLKMIYNIVVMDHELCLFNVSFVQCFAGLSHCIARRAQQLNNKVVQYSKVLVIFRNTET